MVCGSFTPEIPNYTYPPELQEILGPNYLRDVTEIAPDFIMLDDEEKIEALYRRKELKQLEKYCSRRAPLF